MNQMLTTNEPARTVQVSFKGGTVSSTSQIQLQEKYSDLRGALQPAADYLLENPSNLADRFLHARRVALLRALHSKAAVARRPYLASFFAAGRAVAGRWRASLGSVSHRAGAPRRSCYPNTATLVRSGHLRRLTGLGIARFCCFDAGPVGVRGAQILGRRGQSSVRQSAFPILSRRDDVPCKIPHWGSSQPVRPGGTRGDRRGGACNSGSGPRQGPMIHHEHQTQGRNSCSIS